MIAGLPGTGLGGLFFIVSALVMPPVHLWRIASRRPASGGWKFVGRHLLIAVGMLAAIEAVGRGIRWTIAAITAGFGEATVASPGRAAAEASVLWTDVAGMPAALLAVGVLGGLLVALHLLAMVVGRRPAAASEH